MPPTKVDRTSSQDQLDAIRFTAAPCVELRQTRLSPEAVLQTCEKNTLLEACCNNDIRVVGDLLKQGRDPNTRNQFGWTALHFAAYSGSAAITNLLLEFHAEVNETTTCARNSPLHRAVLEDNPDIVKVLVENGADMDSQNTLGHTPLGLAPLSGCTEAVRILLSMGADVRKASRAGWTPLHQACALNCGDIVKLLIDAGADVSAETKDGLTPLDVASPGVSKQLQPTVRTKRKHGSEDEENQDQVVPVYHRKCRALIREPTEAVSMCHNPGLRAARRLERKLDDDLVDLIEVCDISPSCSDALLDEGILSLRDLRDYSENETTEGEVPRETIRRLLYAASNQA